MKCKQPEAQQRPLLTADHTFAEQQRKRDFLGSQRPFVGMKVMETTTKEERHESQQPPELFPLEIGFHTSGKTEEIKQQ